MFALSDPSITPTPSAFPTPSASSAADAFGNEVINRLTGQGPTPITCTRDDISVCGLVYKVTGNERLGKVLQVVLGTPLQILLIILLALLLRRFVIKLIDRLGERIANGAAAAGRNGPTTNGPLLITRRNARARTLAQVLRSVTSVIVAIVAILMVLQELNLPIAPLLAGASVVGVALGLGAQSLVRDVVAGMFMIVEDQYGVGDVVDVGAASGVVEAVGLRITRLRDVNGTVWYVRNGEIMRVGNHSQGWSRAVLDVNVGYGEDVERVERMLLEIADDLRADPRFSVFVLEEPEVWGVEEMTADSVVIRLAMKTHPEHQAQIARELRRRIKDRFGAEGIEMHTMPRTVIINEEEDRPTAADADALEQ